VHVNSIYENVKQRLARSGRAEPLAPPINILLVKS
jgi:hypothetical protein